MKDEADVTGRTVRVRTTGTPELPIALTSGSHEAPEADHEVLLTEDEALTLLLDLADCTGLHLLYFDFLNLCDGIDDPARPMHERVARAKACSASRIAERAADIGEHELLRRIFGPDVKIPHEKPEQ